MLVEREKANRLRHSMYGKWYRLCKKLDHTLHNYIYGACGNRYRAKKERAQLREGDSSGVKQMIDDMIFYQKKYAELNKFLKERRTRFSKERKKLGLWISWDGANNYRYIQFEKSVLEFDVYGVLADKCWQYVLDRKEIERRAQDYVLDRMLLEGKQIKNMYSLKGKSYEPKRRRSSKDEKMLEQDKSSL
jgi:hypothetical protein